MRKARRIKIPDGADLLDHQKMRSHWLWYWKHSRKDLPKKIRIDIDEKATE